MLTDAERHRLRWLLERAARRPWRADCRNIGHGCVLRRIHDADGNTVVDDDPNHLHDGMRPADADAIVAAVNGAEALLDEIDYLLAQRDKAVAALKRLEASKG